MSQSPIDAQVTRRRSVSWRVSAYVATIVTIALLVMIAASGLALRAWMTGQVDQSLNDNLHRVMSAPERDDRRSPRYDPNATAPSSPMTTPSDDDDDDDVDYDDDDDDDVDYDDDAADDAPQQSIQSGAVPPQLDRPGSTEGSIQLVRRGESVSAGVVTNFTVVPLPDEVVEVLLSVTPNEVPHTIDLPGLGDYRVLAGQNDAGLFIVGQPMADIGRTSGTLVLMEMAVAAALVGMVALLGLWWVRRELRPLARVSATARTIGARDLQSDAIEPFERVPEDFARPGTEVGDVGIALNTMIDNVEAALQARLASEERLRQFVADASHELRTPLASIQGYAQLLAKHSVDPDLALTRIGSESKRMSGLVEDMLLLARLDAGRELERVPTDIAPLVIDAITDAHAAGPDHEWSLDIDLDSGTTYIALADEMGVRQILTNLLANARAHTPPGTKVVCGLKRARAGGAPTTSGASTRSEAPAPVIITVCDNGPGIPPELRESMFDRFVRGDSSRSRSTTPGASGSSGLGLAIVDTIVHALGGRVDVDSTPDGTTFSVTLPGA